MFLLAGTSRATSAASSASGLFSFCDLGSRCGGSGRGRMDAGLIQRRGVFSRIVIAAGVMAGVALMNGFLTVFLIVGVFPGFPELVTILSLARIPLFVALLILTVAVAVVAMLGSALFLLMLLGLEAALLLRPLVECGGKFLQGGHELRAEIALGFVSFFDRLGHLLDGAREAFNGGMDRFQAGGDAFEHVELRVVLGRIHE